METINIPWLAFFLVQVLAYIGLVILAFSNFGRINHVSGAGRSFWAFVVLFIPIIGALAFLAFLPTLVSQASRSQ